MAIKRALNYEEKSRKSDKKLIKEYIKEIEREMMEEKKDKWKTHREDRLRRNGLEKWVMVKIREEEEGDVKRVVQYVIEKKSKRGRKGEGR